MQKTILVIRIVFFFLCILASYLICLSIKEWDRYQGWAVLIGACLGALVILVDILLKGFSLRGLTAMTFGLFIGWLMAFFLANSPLLEMADAETLFLARLVLFLALMYLGAVLALRGKDEFNLIIPYMRFVPHEVNVPLAVVDTSALIDGRIAGICKSGFLGYALLIPRFVLDELQNVADSRDPVRQAKGRKGLSVINELKRIPGLDLRIHESSVDKPQKVDAKLIFLARSLNAKLLTMDYNLAQLAEFHSVKWLNINALAKALSDEFVIGDSLEVDLVKSGKEPGQAVGFLRDGSMVVVNDSEDFIGESVMVQIQSILPSAGGKMVFAKRNSQEAG